MTYHLAQYNIGRLNFPVDAPETKDFVDLLDEVNATADAAPGFVWRLQTEDGDATAFDPYDDPQMIINLSVWEDLESLKAFTYKGDHVGVFQRRTEWFAPRDQPMVVMWWVPAGHVPPIAEAADRLEQLRRNGPTAAAFTFGRSFDPPHVETPTTP